MQLHDNIPSYHDYQQLLNTEMFKDMENYSNQYLLKNQRILKSYKVRWVPDPLHQWSRQWEYPYVYSKIEKLIQSYETATVLDAGSGVTFFPYYILSKFPKTKLHCCDYDTSFVDTYERLNKKNSVNVVFQAADLRALPFDADMFDLIYSVSVLEHTDAYEQILNEFHKVLKPGGKLVITFDISLDGTRDIDVHRATSLIDMVNTCFNQSQLQIDLAQELENSDIMTTLVAKDIDPKLLPWRLPNFVYRLKSFVETRKLISWPPALTVCCVELTKAG